MGCPPCENTFGNGCFNDHVCCPKNPWMDCSTVYGGMSSGGSQTIHLTPNARGTPLGMSAPLPSRNVNFNGSNTLTVLCAGTYKLTFFGNFRFACNGMLRFYVRANGEMLNGTVVQLCVYAGKYQSFEVSVIVRICANTNLAPLVDNGVPGHCCSGFSPCTCMPSGTPPSPPICCDGMPGDLFIPNNGMHLTVQRIGPY